VLHLTRKRRETPERRKCPEKAYTTKVTTDVSSEISQQNSDSPVQRTSADIGKLIGEATAKGDIKNLHELATELFAALKREAQAEVDALTEAVRKRVNPLKDQFIRNIDRTEGLVDFIRENGGVLNFSYVLAAEGSDQGPMVSIGVSATARGAASAPKAPRAAGTSTGTGGGKGNVYIVAGTRLSLSGAFEEVATSEEKSAAEVASHKETRPDAAVWAIKSRVVNKAAEAGRVSIESAS
jgi:hypothetical protein